MHILYRSLFVQQITLQSVLFNNELLAVNQTIRNLDNLLLNVIVSNYILPIINSSFLTIHISKLSPFSNGIVSEKRGSDGTKAPWKFKIFKQDAFLVNLEI